MKEGALASQLVCAWCVATDLPGKETPHFSPERRKRGGHSEAKIRIA